MHTFTDEFGREWRLSLTYAVLKRLKSADLDVFDFICEETGDFERLVRILWCWLEPQIDTKGVSPDEFAESLGGEAIATAYLAVRDEVLDFLSHTNPALAATLRKAAAAIDSVTARITQAAESISLPGTASA